MHSHGVATTALMFSLRLPPPFAVVPKEGKNEAFVAICLPTGQMVGIKQKQCAIAHRYHSGLNKDTPAFVGQYRGEVGDRRNAVTHPWAPRLLASSTFQGSCSYLWLEHLLCFGDICHWRQLSIILDLLHSRNQGFNPNPVPCSCSGVVGRHMSVHWS